MVALVVSGLTVEIGGTTVEQPYNNRRTTVEQPWRCGYASLFQASVLGCVAVVPLLLRVCLTFFFPEERCNGPEKSHGRPRLS